MSWHRARRTLLIVMAVGCSFAANAADIPPGKRVSGYEQMSPVTRALQDDELANPALLWLLDGEAAWRSKSVAAQKSCADCHGDAASSMKGVAARYPLRDTARAMTLNLEARVNLCRTERQNAAPLPYESRELIGLTLLVARWSKGLPISIDATALRKEIESGRVFFALRQGQLDISCAQCHDDNWGRKLAGNTIPQGHPTGYPQYRLEWQAVGSLHRRLRNCLSGMRAENLAAGSAELVALEAFLMDRARGLPLEALAVRP
jgi:sulfur-oxidizing protein SoxA